MCNSTLENKVELCEKEGNGKDNTMSMMRRRG